MAKEKFVVAVKDVKTQPGQILPGKVLGSYRKREFADRDRYKLAMRAGFGSDSWRVGIFQDKKLLS